MILVRARNMATYRHVARELLSPVARELLSPVARDLLSPRARESFFRTCRCFRAATVDKLQPRTVTFRSALEV